MRKQILNIVFYSFLALVIVCGVTISILNHLRQRDEFISGITDYGTSSASSDSAVLRTVGAVDIISRPIEGEKGRLVAAKYIPALEELQVTIQVKGSDYSVFVEDSGTDPVAYGSGVTDSFGDYQRFVVSHFNPAAYGEFYIVLLQANGGDAQEFDRFLLVASSEGELQFT